VNLKLRLNPYCIGTVIERAILDKYLIINIFGEIFKTKTRIYNNMHKKKSLQEL